MLILGVESSCDETAFAVVEDGRRVLSNAIASQVELHARHGGVVPEIASRAHLECCVPLLQRALDDAGVTLDQIDALAVTQGPGLAGCLLVGLEMAKGLAFRHGKPLVPVHHIAAHAWSVQLERDEGEGRRAEGKNKAEGGRLKTEERNNVGNTAVAASISGSPLPTPDSRSPIPHSLLPTPHSPFATPYVALVVSGGHSSLILVRGATEMETLGETMDDAVGEAYDKVAKLLKLGYPGGPLMDKLAATGNAARYALPRPVMSGEHLDFSFSGLKSAVARLVEKGDIDPARATDVADLAASFQAACVEVLLTKAQRALEQTGVRRLAIVGGVACNRGLRAAAAQLKDIQLAIPDPEFCTDNAAMIAGLGFELMRSGRRADLGLNAEPGLALSNSGA